MHMRQASLLVLQLIAVRHISPKNMVLCEILDQSINLEFEYPVYNVWPIKSCQAMAILLQYISHFSPVEVSSNSHEKRGLAIVSHNSH